MSPWILNRGMTLQNVLKSRKTRCLVVVLAIALGYLPVLAEGTRTWEQSKFDDLIKGTAGGVAIRSTGGLELAPSFNLLYSTPSTYIWAVAADDAGNVYAATGSPARVYRITPDGKSTIIFEPQELQVQALKVGPGGAIYAATAPDGKVYKIEHKPGEKTEPGKSSENPPKDAKPALDASWSSSVYFAPGTKYIWDLIFDKSGNLYVATGDRGEIYKVTPKGEHSIFFKSDETHIRVLALDAQANLIAGTDGSGLVYRISPAGEGFVLYSAPKKEITALALDREGNIYAAGVGEKRAGSGASSAGATSMLLTISPAPSAGPQLGPVPLTTPSTVPITSFPSSGAGVSGGSDVYRIAADGSPSRVWTSHEDIVYALAFDSHDKLLAGTGNRGHVFAIDGPDEFSDLLKAPASQVTSFAQAPGGGLYAASSNLGKIFILGPAPQSEGSYASDVFDAKIFSRWGRVEFRVAGNVDLLARSGNVDNPDRNWSPWKQVDLSKGAEMGVPAARYAQWKVVLHAGSTKPAVGTVTLNYLPKNVAPEIDDVLSAARRSLPAALEINRTHPQYGREWVFRRSLRIPRTQQPRSRLDRREMERARRKRRSTRVFRLLPRRWRISLAPAERRCHRQGLFFRRQPATRRRLYRQGRGFRFAFALAGRGADGVAREPPI